MLACGCFIRQLAAVIAVEHKRIPKHQGQPNLCPTQSRDIARRRRFSHHRAVAAVGNDSFSEPRASGRGRSAGETRDWFLFRRPALPTAFGTDFEALVFSSKN